MFTEKQYPTPHKYLICKPMPGWSVVRRLEIRHTIVAPNNRNGFKPFSFYNTAASIIDVKTSEMITA